MKWKAPLWTAIFAAALGLATIAAYSNSFSGPFVFDDLVSIAHNPTIRHLWPPGAALRPPPGGSTVSGRPVLNFSFAVNYALGGLEVRGYHAVNLALHLLAAWTLFGLARRTLRRTSIIASPEEACSVGFLLALLWALHPLQTESVTYVVQRAESLAGLFYLLTLYCFLRGIDADRRESGVAGGASADERAPARTAFVWFVLSWLACLLGMATKEVMASAPLLVLLYDQTFAAGTFSEALRRRKGAYAGLFATWLPLVWLILSAPDRGGTAGFGMGLKASVIYARAQFPAILHYLRLAVWPRPLVFDYGTDWSQNGGEGWLPACAVAALLALTVYGLRRRRAAGFLGAWFFLILAPSSSIIPVATERMAEHRMYLPLAAVVALAVGATFAYARRIHGGGFRALFWAGWLGAALGLGSLTYARNGTYRSELALWRDTAAKRPDNYSAHNNLALSLEAAGDAAAAVAEYTAALRLEPEDAKVRNNFGRFLVRLGRIPEAARQFQEALRTDPDNPEAHNNLGVTLAITGRLEDALAQFDSALREKPGYAEAHDNRGHALQRLGRENEAAQEFAEGRRLRSAAAP